MPFEVFFIQAKLRTMLCGQEMKVAMILRLLSKKMQMLNALRRRKSLQSLQHHIFLRRTLLLWHAVFVIACSTFLIRSRHRNLPTCVQWRQVLA